MVLGAKSAPAAPKRKPTQPYLRSLRHKNTTHDQLVEKWHQDALQAALQFQNI